MPLVEYSDSEESQKDEAPPTESHQARLPKSLKRKYSASSAADLPPLPDAFHDLYASAVRVSNKDDPSLHGGRQRVIPHIEGNWPTHVYIECTSDSNLSRLLSFKEAQQLTRSRVSFERRIKQIEQSDPSSK